MIKVTIGQHHDGVGVGVGPMIVVTTVSEPGGHPDNEDAFAVVRHPDDPAGWLGFLADGQGGRSGGGEAARLACRVAAEAASAATRRALARPSTWVEILAEADRAVLRDPDAGFTTLLGFAIAKGSLVGASSGDSAALALTAGAAVDLTGGQIKNPPVGSGVARFVPFSTRLVGPWSVLAMSDGVWKPVGWGPLVAVARSGRGAPLAASLRDAARLPRSGQLADDFTLLLFEGDD